MKNIVNINSSFKGKESFSFKLSQAILEKLLSAYPGSSIKTRDLSKDAFPHLEDIHFAAFRTPVEKRTAEHLEAIKHSEEAIGELKEADIIVLGVPLHNFGIPSVLKAWIDHIVRADATFKYMNGAAEGLIINKRVFLAIASGWVYSEGPMKRYDYTENYLRTILGFIGMTNITAFRVEGIAIPELKETALTKAFAAVQDYVF